uniref:uncharacterized protein n=1 Tax=Semicossyphus pulcher TaxID=241346 RepID=UPI0037E88A46
MSAAVDFHSQIASIMEVLANAAVAEICKVVDDGYAVVHLEMSRSRKESEFLRRKIKLLELQVARYRAERLKAAEGSISSRFPGVRLLSRQSRDSAAGPSLQGRTRFLNRGPGAQQCMQKTPPIILDQDPDQEVVTTTKTEAQRRPTHTRSAQSEEEEMEEVTGDPPQKRSPSHMLLDQQESSQTGDTGQPSCSTSTADSSAGSSSFSLTGPVRSLPVSAKSHTPQRDRPESPSDVVVIDFSRMSSGAGGGDGAEGQSRSQFPPLLCLQVNEPVSEAMWDRNTAPVHMQTAAPQLQHSWPGVRQTDHFPGQNLVYQAPGGQNQESGSLQPRLPFACSFCTRRYAHQCQLRIHQRVHTGEKPYQCSQCGKTFGQVCSLKRHQMVHTGERPFPCPHCGKQFSTSTNLKVHQSVHTGEKRFHCSKCGKNFSFLSNLIRHQALHSNK